jgi:mRNA-degrading endonuclease toxin of MazEF toxin-antitoxin module
MRIKPGEVWLADLGLAAKTRPILVVSREDPDPPRSLVIYAPLTTQNRGSQHEVGVTQAPIFDERVYGQCARSWLNPYCQAGA